MVVVMVMVDATAGHLRSRRRHCDSGDRDCGECRDEFDLVHGVVPFCVLRKPILALTQG